MSDVSHGVNASKTSNGTITPVSVDTGVHFVVGTAPVQMVNGKVNEVIMASSYPEAVQALGYSDDWKKYSICEEIYTAFTLFNSAQVFFVNVLGDFLQGCRILLTEELFGSQAVAVLDIHVVDPVPHLLVDDIGFGIKHTPPWAGLMRKTPHDSTLCPCGRRVRDYALCFFSSSRC